MRQIIVVPFLTLALAGLVKGQETTGPGGLESTGVLRKANGRGVVRGVPVVHSRQQESVGPGGARDTEPLPGDA